MVKKTNKVIQVTIPRKLLEDVTKMIEWLNTQHVSDDKLTLSRFVTMGLMLMMSGSQNNTTSEEHKEDLEEC